MGDRRFEAQYARVARSKDRARVLRRMEDEHVVEALAGASRAGDPLLSNVLATEATNRIRRLRASLAHLGEGVLALDLAGRIRWANPAAERLLGCPWAEMSGQPFEAIVRPEDARGSPRHALDPTSNVVTDGEWVRRRDGERVCLRLTSAPVLAPDGEADGLVIALSDCTARKLAERELAESKERYRALFDGSADAIATVSPDGIVLEANAAMERVIGIPVAEARGRRFHDFVHPHDVDRVARLLRDALHGETRIELLRVARRGGNVGLMEARVIPVVVDGSVVAVHGVVRPLSLS